ncbi:hypothetical protein MKZ38_006106 [Zalerion maritima]|uniref:Guanine nucleotide-exchange factor SEC12 n=1 Tax=Zalerion maritima TaxID=339359 RepID=A0AAD5WWE3_9PEZI|nr:hypothetical protein MKZ38_006106 [Zalerion maritima]
MAAILDSKITLSYPLYACEFDPQDSNRLVVAGGGGSSRSGVGNKITVLDTSIRDDLRLAGELDLRPDEDNVTTLAFGHTKGKAAALYAGVNSSPTSIEKGKNEHLRTISVEVASRSSSTSSGSSSSTKYPKKSSTGSSSSSIGSTITAPLRTPKVTEVARTSLFEAKDKDAYQRLLRLPPPPTSGSTLVGAAASGFSSDPEISLFETGSSTSGPGAAVRPRGRLALDRDAMDLDVIQTADDTYQLAHCDDHELYLFTVAKASHSNTASLASPTSSGPECVYTIPHDQSSGSPDAKVRPAFRSIRYLTSSFLLAVANLPRRQGVVLQGLRLPEDPGKTRRMARLSVSRRLPKAVSQATGLAVRNLSPPSTPGSSTGDTQFLIAVAGHDASISLFTLDHTTSKTIKVSPTTNPTGGGIELLSNLLPFATLNSIHPTHITGLSFSVFQPPMPPGSSTAVAKKPPPVVKLASVSVGNTAVVHSIPLRRAPEPPKPKGAKKLPASIPRPAQRYIVAVPPKKDKPIGLMVVGVVFVLILAIVGQAFLEIQGFTGTEILGARNAVPQGWVKDPLPKHRHGYGYGEHGGFLFKLINEIEDLGVDMSHFHGPARKKIILRGEGSVFAPDGDDKVKSEPAKEGEEDADVVALPGLGLTVEIHDEEVHDKVREWDELEAPEREAWKRKLKESGHWVESMGETVFKGILFGEIGGLVGNFMAAGAGM